MHATLLGKLQPAIRQKILYHNLSVTLRYPHSYECLIKIGFCEHPVFDGIQHRSASLGVGFPLIGSERVPSTRAYHV